MQTSPLADHFFSPRNVGEAPEPSFVGRSASLACGGSAQFSVQIGIDHDIQQARFKAAGCNVLIASLSVLTELVKHKTTAEAAAIGNDQQQLSDYFAGLTTAQMACSTVARQALLEALRSFSDAARSEWNGDEALICTCFCVSEHTIENAIRTGGLTSVSEVTRSCYAGGGCGSCHQLIRELIDSNA